MTNIEETVINLTKYLKKMRYLIEKESKLVFFDKSLVSTRRIDDIFCCIEAAWPSEYKNFLEEYGEINLKTPKLYKALKLATKNKFSITSSLCVVYRHKAFMAIDAILESIKKDMKFIYNSEQ